MRPTSSWMDKKEGAPIKVFIVPNMNKIPAESSTRQVAKLLLTQGCEVLLEHEYKLIFSDIPATFTSSEEGMALCHWVVSIGGDGTILQAAKQAAVFQKPILGINTGRLGYLAQLEISEIARLDEVVKGNYLLEERMFLKATVHRANGDKNAFYALNDVVMSRLVVGKMIDVEIQCNQKVFTRYRADGVLFSTPTGSTAYALSAGGSVVDPTVESISMIPICPHSLFDRSIIFSPDKILTVQSKEINNSSQTTIAVDGILMAELDREDYLTIEKAELSAKFIRFPDWDFYQILTQKMIARGH